MSTVKISQLAQIASLNANTSNTLFVAVDLPTGITGKITATTLSQGLYSYNPLNVGNNPILLPNTIAQFSGNSNNYIQINEQNNNNKGTSDYVATADTGTDTTYYVDLGVVNSNYNTNSPYNALGTAIEPLSGYLYVQGNTLSTLGGNLVIGTTVSNTETKIIAGGINSQNVVARFRETGLKLDSNSYITFSDNTTQNTAASPASYTQSINAYAYNANTFLQSNDAITLSSAKYYTDTANTFIKNNYLANTNIITVANNLVVPNTLYVNTISLNNNILTITGNVIINNDSTTFTGYVKPNKGVICLPTIYPGSQTAIVVDFVNNSVIKCNTSSGLTVSFSNYISGKTVKVWITNTAGTNQTFTHGCTALNSTVNSTTYNIPSTSTICCEYISFASDLANTYVSIIHPQ